MQVGFINVERTLMFADLWKIRFDIVVYGFLGGYEVILVHFGGKYCWVD